MHLLSLEFPALNYTLSLDIYTTGKLDCAAFLKQLEGVVHTGGQGKACTSLISQTTTTSSPPAPTDTGDSIRFRVRGGFLAFAVLVACMVSL